MHKFVKSRNACQCRTHHENIMKKFNKSVDRAIDWYIEENLRFFEKYAKVTSRLVIL